MPIAPALHRPIVGLALAVLAGTLLGLALPFYGWPYAAIGGALLLFWKLRRPQHKPSTYLFLAALAISAANAAFSSIREQARVDALQTLQASRTKVEILGHVLTEPEGIRLPHGGARLTFRFHILSLRDPSGEPLPLSSRLLPIDLDAIFYVPESYLGENPGRTVPRAGQAWSFTGKIHARRPPFQATPILSFQTSVEEPYHRAPTADPPRWRQALWELRRSTAQRLALGIENRPQEVAILRAVLLGYRSEVPDTVQALFENSGTVHFFAISGLHILLIAQLLRFLLQRTAIPHRAQPLFLIPILLAYTILTGGRPSAIRACLMTSLYCASSIFYRKPNPIASVAAAAITLLWIDPFQITDLGFLFSFSSVLSILLLATSLKELFLSLLKQSAAHADPVDLLAEQLAPPKPRPFDKLLSIFPKIARHLLLALPVSIAAWAAAEPITARVFGQMVPVSILSNLIVIPLGEITVNCAVIGLLPGTISPLLEVPFNRLAATLVHLMVKTTALFANLPAGHFDVTPWPILVVVLWYLALLSLALLLHVAIQRAKQQPPQENLF